MYIIGCGLCLHNECVDAMPKQCIPSPPSSFQPTFSSPVVSYLQSLQLSVCSLSFQSATGFHYVVLVMCLCMLAKEFQFLLYILVLILKIFDYGIVYIVLRISHETETSQ